MLCNGFVGGSDQIIVASLKKKKAVSIALRAAIGVMLAYLTKTMTVFAPTTYFVAVLCAVLRPECGSVVREYSARLGFRNL